LINLFAFSDGVGMGAWLECLVGPAFRTEVLFVYKDDSLTTRASPAIADFGAAEIRIVEARLSDAERADWVRYAQAVDDGEAQALAIASNRRIPLLTDDTAGIRLGRSLGVETATSLDLAFQWAADRTIDEVRAACRRLRNRTRFAVPRDGSHVDWYRSRLDDA
jgi:predicted nucleic acid-binding protein